MILQVGPTVPAPEGCGDLQLSKTQISDLFVATTPGTARMATGREIDITLEIRGLQYAVRDLQGRMDQTTSHAAEELLCRAHSSTPWSGEIISVAPGRFLQRQGDVIYDFTCPNITVDVRAL